MPETGRLSAELSGRFLIVRLPLLCRALSWAVVGGGLTTSRTVVFWQVDDRKLSPGVDPVELLHRNLEEQRLRASVAMMTSRRLDRFVDHEESLGSVTARVIATVGLSNAVAIGDPATYCNPDPRHSSPPAGTINILCHLSVPLGDAAMVEAISLVAEARTAAALDQPVSSALSGRPITGTGTDCVVVTCPLSGPDHKISPEPYAGKHGIVGSVIGAAVHHAVRLGIRGWQQDRKNGRIAIPEES